MNKELAQKLKNANFPSECWEITRCVGAECNMLTPTLSELIEACGDSFESLCLSNYVGERRYWKAYPTDESYYKNSKNDCVVDCCGYETGDTAEEAVANLWLEINKK